MRYLLLIYDQEKMWATLSEAEVGKVMGEFRAFGESITKSGHYRIGHQLHPTSDAVTLRAPNGKLSTIDGPYAETKEQLGGFYLIEAKDLEEAKGIAARCPGAKYGCVEVRPVVPNRE
jgi:hypothetical protein